MNLTSEFIFRILDNFVRITGGSEECHVSVYLAPKRIFNTLDGFFVVGQDRKMLGEICRISLSLVSIKSSPEPWTNF